jgi:hypothetical protein
LRLTVVLEQQPKNTFPGASAARTAAGVTSRPHLSQFVYLYYPRARGRVIFFFVSDLFPRLRGFI